jgi:hypothetical protein
MSSAAISRPRSCPSRGWVTVVLIDLEAARHTVLNDCFGKPTAPIPIGENLSLRWTPERGFDHDLREWLCGRWSRLATSPGTTVLELVSIMTAMVREMLDRLHQEAGVDHAPDPDDFDIGDNLAALEDLDEEGVRCRT